MEGKGMMLFTEEVKRGEWKRRNDMPLARRKKGSEGFEKNVKEGKETSKERKGRERKLSEM